LALLSVNGHLHRLEIEDDTPLLWVLRDTIGLTGTKFGCGVSACGACTVHIDGQAVRSCSLPASEALGKEVTTIEGLAADAVDQNGGIDVGKLHPIQQAWIEHQVPQCGYCQSGMIMATAALLAENPEPSDEDIDATMTNVCRCGTYPRLRKAIHAAARQVREG
jgi:isoquinoline 1-oxidoreductase alpha subunit